MEQQTFLKRQTALKFWIKDIIQGTPLEREDIRLFDVRGKEASRVNIMGIVVDKRINEENTFATITIDDSTETIRAKTWKEDIQKLDAVNVGDPVMVIGKIRIYGNEMAVMPEIVKKQETEWLLVRKQELEKEYEKPEEKEQVEQPQQQTEQPPRQIIEEEAVGQPTETSRQRIIQLIDKETSQQGIEISALIQKSGLKEQDAEEIIDELLKEGEVFQPRTGFLKVI
ncbi:MAG: hypothetical protein KKA79_08995 [Nanoarchaeota archaeon]|nr:hypothetical protein [Nanoarchaeota archaeon]MCG2718436.1 OB-fold nucleic acid binding domain-containing protein [Nanoarchaeota archaeon]